MACRRNPRTITIRVKLVSRTRKAGAMERTVIIRTIFKAESIPLGLSMPSREREREGLVASSVAVSVIGRSDWANELAGMNINTLNTRLSMILQQAI